MCIYNYLIIIDSYYYDQLMNFAIFFHVISCLVFNTLALVINQITIFFSATNYIL